MITASNKFKRALKSSHTVVTRAVEMSPIEDGEFVDGFIYDVVSGSLTIDGTRNVRRQGNFVLAYPSDHMYGNFDTVDGRTRLRIERGIRFSNENIEWIPLAVLDVQSATQTLADGTLKVSAYDPSSRVSDFSLVTPYAPIGPDQRPLTTVEAIKDLIDVALWENAVWHVGAGVDQSVYPQAGTVFTGSRWDAVNNLAKSLASVVYVDNVGEWHIDLVQTSDWVACDSLSTGPGGVLIGGTSAQDRSDLFNAVPLRWEGPTGGGLVFLVDNDQQSPTFWGGPFGKKPASEQRVETVTTQQQAIAAAEALLAQYKGFTASIQFTALHNPLLEPGDVLEVEVPNRRLHQLHVIDSISYTLNSGAMSVRTRAVQNISTAGLAVVA